ncbi:MAG: aldo/keto reductase [Cyclobacteriaceae bacterium]|nr:aldo/keto reductase [Cyclobacteriaceae bacterium]
MTITDINGTVSLHNGVEMPYLGLGVFKAKDGEEVIEAIKHALHMGYRHIDTASVYRNENGVGQAIKEGAFKREEIFITTKVWNDSQGYASTLKAYEESLKRLDMEYVDLYLVHWPVKGKYKETWKALESLYKDGRVRAIGVSNFLIHHLKDLLIDCDIIPMVNQIEYHPYLTQSELIKFCLDNDIRPEAWSPLMQGHITEVAELSQLGEKYGKSTAQIALRWNLQKGVITIPKSVNPQRIKANAELFDFELSDEDVARIDALDKGKRFGSDPDNFNF